MYFRRKISWWGSHRGSKESGRARCQHQQMGWRGWRRCQSKFTIQLSDVACKFELLLCLILIVRTLNGVQVLLFVGYVVSFRFVSFYVYYVFTFQLQLVYWSNDSQIVTFVDPNLNAESESHQWNFELCLELSINCECK